MKLELYTDGGASKKGLGGFATIVTIDNEPFKIISGNFAINEPITNNQMELMGILGAILISDRLVSKVGDSTNSITIYSDSQYAIKSLTEWIHNWKKKGWKNSAGQDVKNKYQIAMTEQLLIKLKSKSHVKMQWVKGHNGNRFNEMADSFATTYSCIQEDGFNDDKFERYYNLNSEGLDPKDLLLLSCVDSEITFLELLNFITSEIEEFL